MDQFSKGLITGALIVFFAIGVAHITYAESIPVTVTVEIVDEVSSVTAAVPCNEVNCPDEEVQQVGFFTSIINWFKNLL